MPKVDLDRRLQRDVIEDSVGTAVEGWTLCPQNGYTGSSLREAMVQKWVKEAGGREMTISSGSEKMTRAGEGVTFAAQVSVQPTGI